MLRTFAQKHITLWTLDYNYINFYRSIMIIQYLFSFASYQFRIKNVSTFFFGDKLRNLLRRENLFLFIFNTYDKK